MGEIFLAQLQGSHGFDKLCVIKKILPQLAQDQDFVSRFVDEARTLVKLSHGNIAQVLDMGVNEGSPFIALEFIDGKDLRRVLARMRERNLPLPLSFVLMVMTRVLDALAYAHRKRSDDERDLNLVHRDVSPQNVLISYEGEVKVIDFGLAKSTMSLSKTNPSIVLGKFMYMSPEQARHKPVDRRSDLYAAGLCLWELVTGRNPFDDVPTGELMARVAAPSIPALNTVDPLCPLVLSDVVAKALAPDPAQRFQTAEEFRGKLQLILQDLDPHVGPETTSRFMRDAFAAEFQAERRMLATVKEQARALQPDEVPEPASEPTADNMQSPFAAKLTPLAVPAVTITLDDETPAAPSLRAEALSFVPTPKGPGSPRASKSHDVERETQPAISLKNDSPPAPAPIRARVLARSFDNEATEAATPIIAEPEPLPSIVIDGLPSEAVRTELEIPVQAGGPPPRAAKAPTKKKRPGPDKPRAPSPKPERTGERPRPVKLPEVQRTDTMIIRNPIVADTPAAALAPVPAKKGVKWVWFVLPVVAIAGVGGFIAWDLSRAEQAKQAALEAAELEAAAAEPPPKPQPPPAPRVEVAPTPDAQPPEAEPAPAPSIGATGGDDVGRLIEPKKKPVAPPAAKRAAGTPGEEALRALQADFARLVDEAVQRKFRLQVSALESQVEAKGDDTLFVEKVEALHGQVKAALAKQQ